MGACHEIKDIPKSNHSGITVNNDIIHTHIYNGFDIFTECIAGWPNNSLNDFHKLLFNKYSQYFVTKHAFATQKDHYSETYYDEKKHMYLLKDYESICVFLPNDELINRLVKITSIWDSDVESLEFVGSIKGNKIIYYKQKKICYNQKDVIILTKIEYDKWIAEHPNTKILNF